MKFRCSGCKTIWDEKKVLYVEQFSKSAFCRVCACKCNPMVDKTDLMRFFEENSVEVDTDELPPELPKEDKKETKKEEKKTEDMEEQIKFNWKDSDIDFPPADDEDGWGFD